VAEKEVFGEWYEVKKEYKSKVSLLNKVLKAKN